MADGTPATLATTRDCVLVDAHRFPRTDGAVIDVEEAIIVKSSKVAARIRLTKDSKSQTRGSSSALPMSDQGCDSRSRLLGRTPAGG
jgi:hypothetical protein